jgi:TolB protein
MKADGAGQTQLTTNLVFDATPTWSPDGKKIVFSRLVPDPDPTKPGRQQVFTMNADGTDQTQLTLFDEGVNGGPSWGALWIGGGGPK